ncbi:class I SAM-dependent methyltransferase [Cupriavidus sp. 2KB_3]|uniref:class I SAM-dependent methyltransferase n=1 Tax=Cupriavidus sp. 2KB_3 TaxID=3232980 RepID=UPI003F8EA22D
MTKTSRPKPENPSRIWLDRETAAFGQSLPAGMRVLDAGSGDQRYRSNFAHCLYESADFEKVDKIYGDSTYTCDLAAIPVEDGRFDAVVFSQVMEHLPEPGQVLAELFRVMKPGARLFYSGPLWYEEHEVPYDYYRYTQYGLRHLFTKHGFDMTELRWMDGYMATVTHQLRRMLAYLPKTAEELGNTPNAIALMHELEKFRPVAWEVVHLASQSDIEARYTDRGFPVNYMAIVTKPATA